MEVTGKIAYDESTSVNVGGISRKTVTLQLIFPSQCITVLPAIKIFKYLLNIKLNMGSSRTKTNFRKIHHPGWQNSGAGRTKPSCSTR